MIRYIYDESGNIVTTYTYDAWGRQVSVTGSNVTLGNLNPIRYKSYFYDTDTGFYYLETRFYDPTVGRFISPDDSAYLGASGSALGWNLFSYCENEPVGKVDPDGHEAICISAAAVCCVCIAALATLLTSKAFMSAFSQMCTQIAKDISKGLSVVWNGLSSMATFISGKVKALNKTISLSFAKAKTNPRYKTPTEDHHIVAKMATNAKLAQNILNGVGIGINSQYNLITIKTGLHRRIHTKKYYGLVNSMVISASNKAKTKAGRKANVHAVLGTLKSIISFLNDLAPY